MSSNPAASPETPEIGNTPETREIPDTGPLICIVGPTASGKTALAVVLAQRLHGEVVNADSRQVYRGMTIGAAKPTAAERAAAPHHLLDLLNPSETFGLAPFLIYAAAALREIRARGRLPILCGGTGQYVWGLLNGATVPAAPPDWALRARLESEAARWGAAALHRRLAAIDPARAAALDPRNVRRVIRALEIHHSTGRRPSESPPAAAPPANSLVLGLTLPRDALYHRINVRVDQMMSDGFLEEVQDLAAAGYPPGQGPLNCPGYRELGQYLDGRLSLDQAVEQTKLKTHRLARRQYTWFKPSDPRILWLDAAHPNLPERAAAAARQFLGRQDARPL